MNDYDIDRLRSKLEAYIDTWTLSLSKIKLETIVDVQRRYQVRAALDAFHDLLSDLTESMEVAIGQDAKATADCDADPVNGGCRCCNYTGVIGGGVLAQPCHCLVKLR
jgi:hypothetical protein